VISIVAVIYLINKDDNPSYKLAWVILILLFPIFGGAFYLYMGNKRPSRKLHKILDQEEKDTAYLLLQDEQIMKEIRETDRMSEGQSRYIRDCAGFPVWKHSKTTYFSSGEECYEVILEELKKAEHFIFLEYFIVKEGKMLNQILEILKEKAKQGVEIRFMYDDVGCISELDGQFHKKLEKCGIACCRFNPFIPVVSTAWNNRDHRKIMVIDGHTAFTGGFNLADEYINQERRFGYWKDSGIMIKGDAVWNMTVMFLRTWLPLRREQEDYEQYRPDHYLANKVESDGFVQPYSDTPLDSETVGKNIYLNMIGSAKDYFYITTPYLIIDNELMTALCLAAKRGVDVRIITPGIPDKKYIFLVTQSYFEQLIRAGVKIYSYTKGFIHAKNVVCDGKSATVGTVNWDYRSLYLHFECGVYITHADTIHDIYEDYKNTLKDCKQITLEESMRPLILRLVQSILRVFAPLL
jgi:cardiolipin synthase